MATVEILGAMGLFERIAFYSGEAGGLWLGAAGLVLGLILGAAAASWRRSAKPPAAPPGLAPADIGEALGGWESWSATLIDDAPMLVAVVDREALCFRFVSPYVSELLGHPPEGILAAGTGAFGSIIDPDGTVNWQAHFDGLDLGADGSIIENLVPARHISGQRRWLLCRDQALERGADGRVRQVLSMGTDVTLLMESRRKIIESRNQAEAASRAKDEFMALISHELHTPLNAVFGGTQLIQQEGMTEAQEDYCQIILEGAESLRRLFADLLEYSQAQAEAAGQDEEISLDDEFELINVRGGELSAAAGLRWRFERLDPLPASVRGERVRLHSILRHLIENAIKFTEEGEVRVTVSMPRRRSREVWLRVAVHDTGIGIAADLQERIFDPFQQGEATGTRRFSGTGIGLTIAQRHAQVMGGQIVTESEPGKGSCFRVDLPFRLG